MVCIAAFIILALVGVFVAIISIFKPSVGKSYLKLFKKAWGCLWKKVRLQKCETGFKDDVKNTILSRVIVKHPKWVKPLSVLIEIISVVIVVVVVWAILTAIKSLLALWALGSCNVTKPSACSMGAEICSIDQSEPSNVFEATGRWFEEWGEIFTAIPEKFKNYDAASYDFNYITVAGSTEAEKPIAVDIFDPGCSVCMKSYQNQKAAGFFEDYDVRMVPFAIQDADNSYKFPNSAIIVKYMLAVEQFRSGTAIRILDKIFTEKSSDGRWYFTKFNSVDDDIRYTHDEAVQKLESWLKEFGLNDGEIKAVREIVEFPEIEDKMAQNREIVENEIHVRGIPTMIYGGEKHTGLWQKP